MADITGSLTMCRRAGKLVLGMDEVKNACRSKKAAGVIVAKDLSERSLSEIAYVCDTEGIKLYRTDCTMDDIGYALGKVYGIIAVADSGFMKSMAKNLQELDAYGICC